MLRKIGLGLLILAAGLVSVYLFFVIRAQPLPAHPFFAHEGVLVMAHQGGDGLRPSNTMAAFAHAVELGADVLEMDIHSTRDGVIVTIHDATVDRTTDGTGAVNDFTFAELQQLDAGYDWPTLEGREDETERPFRGQGITIPALEEVLQAFPEMKMNIEIKQREPSIVAPFCAMLRQYQMEDQVLVASFSAEVINAFRTTCPEIPTAGVENEIRVFYVLNTVGLARAFQPTAYAFQVPEYAGDLHVVTPGFVRAAAALNIETHPWTINDADGMQRMIDAGVQGIITDYPDVLLGLLGR